jgi:Fanconi anemia group J protein
MQAGAAGVAEPNNHAIRGHHVRFPHTPYGVQFQFMDKMLRALSEPANALLEAPTGCGKTLSLLCAALAWQEARKEAAAAHAATRETRVVGGAAAAAAAQFLKRHSAGDPDDAALERELGLLQDLREHDDEVEGLPLPEKLEVPKIYFATRTHSQIAQVVRELKRTSYKPSMAVLVRGPGGAHGP